MMKVILAMLMACLMLITVFSVCFTASAASETRDARSVVWSSDDGQYEDSLDMLVFVSPQYAGDTDIRNAINNYIAAVKDDVRWGSEIIEISPFYNNFVAIDNIIESYYDTHNIKACIMVGEDTDTALHCDVNYKEVPSTVPWWTTGGESAYEFIDNQVRSTSYLMDICISLIYPTSDLDYEIKKSQIASVFNKFSQDRFTYYDGNILTFTDSEMPAVNEDFREILNNLENYGNHICKEDPSESDILDSLTESYSLYMVHGHSNPTCTDVHSTKSIYFRAQYLDGLSTPFFGATGCKVGGWWSDEPDNNILDPSITHEGYPHYSSRIFSSSHLRVMVLGSLFQKEYYSYRGFNVSFITNVFPELLTTGKTIAECMIGNMLMGGCQIIVGDPTFHYSFDQNPPEKPTITGTTNGKPGNSYTYTFTSTDPDGDQVSYYIEWGDGTTSGWTAFQDSGTPYYESHTWEENGFYTIKAIAKDIYGVESDEGTLSVSMPKNKDNNNKDESTRQSLFSRIVDRFRGSTDESDSSDGQQSSLFTQVLQSIFGRSASDTQTPASTPVFPIIRELLLRLR